MACSSDLEARTFALNQKIRTLGSKVQRLNYLTLKLRLSYLRRHQAGTSIPNRAGLVSVTLTEHLEERLEENLNVEPQTPIVDIP